LLVRALGAGTVAFGIGPILAPRAFAIAAGLPYHGEPAAKVAIRSVGVRDLANGIGLLATSSQPERSNAWLLLRCVFDAGDALACCSALRGDPKNGRLRALAAFACGAALFDGVLLAWVKTQRTASP
jgi:hypothetical protein